MSLKKLKLTLMLLGWEEDEEEREYGNALLTYVKPGVFLMDIHKNAVANPHVAKEYIIFFKPDEYSWEDVKTIKKGNIYKKAIKWLHKHEH